MACKCGGKRRADPARCGEPDRGTQRSHTVFVVTIDGQDTEFVSFREARVYAAEHGASIGHRRIPTAR